MNAAPRGWSKGERVVLPAIPALGWNEERGMVVEVRDAVSVDGIILEVLVDFQYRKSPSDNGLRTVFARDVEREGGSLC